MTKGYIVYESFYYSSEYINKIDHTPGTIIWDDECDNNNLIYVLDNNVIYKKI